jgi:HEAT repeat protein
MFLPVRRTFHVTLLSLAPCALLLLVGCCREGDNRQAEQDKAPAKKAPTDSEKTNDVAAERPTPAKADDELKGLSHKGKPLAEWIAQLQDNDKDARIKAAEALVDFCDRDEPPPEAVLRALAQALRDKDDTVRFVASGGLHRVAKAPRIHEKHFVPLFVDALKDKDAKVRRRAAEGLEGCESAIPALGELLLKDKDAEVRQTVAFVLGRMGKPAVPVLITALKSPDKETRRIAAGAFRQFSSDRRDARQAIPVLAELLKEDDKDLRCEVASVLTQLGDPAGEALPALLLASKVPDSGGDQAKAALEQIRKAPRSAAPALIALLKDEEPRIRLRAAELLCDVEEGDKECLACLVGLIKRRDSQIRQRTTVLLARYGSAARDAVPALIEVLRTDADPQIQRNAINALGAIGPDAKAAVPLLKSLEKAHQKQLAEAEETLKRIGKPVRPYDADWTSANSAKSYSKERLSVVQAALTKMEQ